MLATIVLATAAVAAAPPAENADNVDMRCGAYCLYVSLKALNVAVPSYAELEGKLGPASANGYSLGHMADVAQQYGAKTLGVVTTPENLALRPRPFACIALFGKNHFVNIGDIADGKCIFIDAPNKFEIPLDALRGAWDGTALLISTSPLAPEEELERPSWALTGGVAVLGVVLVGGAVVWFRGRVGGSR